MSVQRAVISVVESDIKMKSSNLALVVFILALLFAGGLYFYDQKSKDSAESAAGELEELSAGANNEESDLPAPERIDLSAVGDSEASGVSSRVYVGNEFIITINADLPSIAESRYYNAYVEDVRSGTKVNLGKVVTDGGASYLEYKGEKDLGSYKSLSVVLEDSRDASISQIILKGQF